MATTLRAQLLSSAEHTLAVAKLGSDYEAEAYLQTIDLIRATGSAEQYVDKVLGVDVDALTTSDKEGAAIHKAALANLARRGIDDPSYRQLADALAEVSR